MMLERICPHCEQANPLDNRYCGQCGALLEKGALAPYRESPLTIGAGRFLPAPSLRQVGQAVAVSLVALAAEAGLSWLRSRLTTAEPSTALVRQAPRQRPPAQIEQQERVASSPMRWMAQITTQRIVRVWGSDPYQIESLVEEIWEQEG